MLLQRLVQLAQSSPDRVPPPYYKPHQIRWVLDLAADGSTRSSRLSDLADPSDPATKRGRTHIVPSITKTVGIAPRIAVDSPEYLFGWILAGSKPDRVRKAHQSFRKLNDAWVAEDPQGPARALQRFYLDGHLESFPQEEDCSRGELIAVRVAGKFLHETDSARRFWFHVASSRKASDTRGLCLVCGKMDRLLKTIPQQLPARLVPMATQTVSLVSVNKPTHGFALQEQLVHTPICVVCGLSAMNALEQLLDDQWRSTLAGQDTRLAWWLTRKIEFDLDALDQPTPERVANLIGSAAHGHEDEPLSQEELANFCAVAIGGNVSRVMIRDWIDLPLGKVQQHLQAWFDDHQIVDAWTGEIRQVGLRGMARVCGRWVNGAHGARGSYANFGASGADRPEGVHWALLRSALLGKQLPPKLLAHLVGRVCTDGRLDTERAALIRLALRRRLGSPQREEYLPTLNPDNRRPAYLAGRVFAVLEDIQISAAWAEGDDPPNVTFADRYFARAVTSPAVAIVAGRRDAQAWLKRMARSRPAFAHKARQRLDELFAGLNEAGGVPHGVVLADQAAFILGYHQQWAELRTERKRPADPQDSQEEGAAR